MGYDLVVMLSRVSPLAFQFVGRQFDEEMLVRAGYAYQTATDWHRKHPTLPSD